MASPALASAAANPTESDDLFGPDIVMDEGVLSLTANLTPEQAKIFLCADNGDSFFYTGAAGTGKSFLLNMIIDHLRKKHGSSVVHVTAPSASAALLVGGTTIHTFAGLNIDMEEDWKLKVIKARQQRDTLNRWMTCKVLIIDEISMASAEMLNLLNYMAMQLRKSEEPFGGIQVIMSGDFMQLPPVFNLPQAKKERLWEEYEQEVPNPYERMTPREFFDEYVREHDGAKFAFQSPVWAALVGPRKFQLTKIYRQADPDFVSVLNEVRMGKLSPIGHMRLLQCVKRVFPDKTDPTYLYPKKDMVDSKNRTELAKLSSVPYVFTAVDKVYDPKVDPKSIDKASLAVKSLTLKLGAEVLLIKNLNIGRGLVNGTRGRVVAFSNPTLSTNDDQEPVAANSGSSGGDGDNELDAALKPLPKDQRPPLPDGLAPGENIPLVRFVVKGESEGVLKWITTASFKSTRGDKVLSERIQVPLLLGYAVTVHKSQGMTLDYVCINLENVFADGQAYVALSRARSIEGLRIENKFETSIVHANPMAVAFENSLAKLK